MEAKWNGKIIAKSNETIIVEKNHYFPPDSINKEYLKASTHSSVCPWKGKASYYNLVVEGKTNIDAAWYYPQPKLMAKDIQNYIAFWNGVQVVKE